MKRIILLLTMLANIAFSQDNEYRVETTKIGDNLYEIYSYLNSNLSVNLFVFTGEEGTLLIDSGMDLTVNLVQKELEKIGISDIKFLINTHNDGDHTFGNPVLGKNATIISHKNLPPYLVNNPRFAEGGLPNLTFDDSLRVFFNGEEIIVRYLPGHTDNDIYVEFKNSGLLFMGDMAFEKSFPVVHNNGNIDNLIRSLTYITANYSPETKLLVSHGRPTYVSEIPKYLEMIRETKAVILNAIKSGVNLDQAKQDKMLNKWEYWNSNVFETVNCDSWIESIYKVTEEGKATMASNKLRLMINSDGWLKASEEFENLRRNTSLYFDEDDFNGLGYEYLFNNKLDEAILVFKVNTELYPYSANSYDSLGEAYMTAGQYDLALKNYRKSLELNPENTNANQMIEKIKSGLND